MAKFAAAALVLASYLCLSCILPAVCGKTVQFIDDGDKLVDIEALAKAVCKTSSGYDKQIGREATITRLAEYFQAMPWEVCGQKYVRSLVMLHKLMMAGDEDVCDGQKIQLIEEYHQRYISKAKKYRTEQEINRWKAPWLVQLFFMQYASQVSTICEHSAAIVTAQMADQLEKEEITLFGDHDKFLKPLIEASGVSDLSTDSYNDLFLVWNQINKLTSEESGKLSLYLNNQGPVRMTVLLRELGRIGQLRELCAKKIYPVYGKHLLPVLRMVDMGYYPPGCLLKEASEHHTSRHLVAVAQICEILRPVRLVVEPSLAPNQVVPLARDDSRAEEAAELKDDYEADNLDKRVELVSNRLPERWMDAQRAQDSGKKVMESTGKRFDANRTMLKKMIDNFKSKDKSEPGFFLVGSNEL